MTLEEQLRAKYAAIKNLSDEIPLELAQKIRLYSEALLLIGKLQAAATYEYGKAYADRKRAYGQALIETQGTAAEKEGAAQVAAHPLRLAEAKAEAEMTEWKTAFSATQEIVNALKMELRVLMKEMGEG